MRSPLLLLLTVLALGNASGADAKPQPPSDQDAAGIAAHIIRLRALDAASSGNSDLAIQLESLAHGVAEGRIGLADAALVMQIANTPARVVAPLTAQARSATRAAESLLDGDAGTATAASTPTARPAPAASAAGAAPLAAMPGAEAPMSATTAPAAPGSAAASVATLPGMSASGTDAVGTGRSFKVYDVDKGTGTQVIVVALGVSAKQGAEVGQRYLITRGSTTIAEARISRIHGNLSYGEIIKGSLRDQSNDVREGDLAVLEP